MSGTFSTNTDANKTFGSKPRSHGVAPTAQRAGKDGSSGNKFRIALENGAGVIALENGAGAIALESAP